MDDIQGPNAASAKAVQLFASVCIHFSKQLAVNLLTPFQQKSFDCLMKQIVLFTSNLPNMKSKHFFSLVFLSLFAVACHKKDDALASSSSAKKGMLCAHTWKYFQYYIDYNQANTQLVYGIYKQNNLQDLSKARIKYNLDGSYTETDEKGLNQTGSYKLNADETVIEKTANNSTTSIKLSYVDEKSFQWTSMDVNTVGIMIPE